MAEAGRFQARTAAACWLTDAFHEADPSSTAEYSSGNMVWLLYTRRGCHLCEAAEDMVATHAPAGAVEIVDVDGTSDLNDRFGSRVPVLVAGGTVVMEGRFDEPRLARLLTAPVSAPDDPGRR
jgi:glutaredoxin